MMMLNSSKWFIPLLFILVLSGTCAANDCSALVLQLTAVMGNNRESATIVADASNGDPPYNYSSDNISFSTNSAFGPYKGGGVQKTFWVSDANKCIVSKNITLPLTVTTEVYCHIGINATCPGSYSSIVFEDTSSTSGSNSYSIDGINYYIQTSINSLPGIYACYVRFSGVLPSFITQPTTNVTVPAPSSTLSCTFCFPFGNTSLAIIYAGGGSGQYMYKKIDRDYHENTIGVFDWPVDIPPDSLDYPIFTASDATCVAHCVEEIPDYDLQMGYDITISSPTCNGRKNGYFYTNVTRFPDLPQGLLSYSIDGINYQTASLFSGLGAGMITLLIRSGVTAPYSCSDATTFYIPEPINLTANVTVLQYPTSQGNGTFVINAFGGHGPYRYEIDVMSNQFDVPEFRDLQAGSYDIVVSDSNMCTFHLEYELYILGDPPRMYVKVTDANCIKNGSLGDITLTARRGIPPYRYSIDGVNYYNTSYFGDLTPGNYSVSVMDSNNSVVQNYIQVLNLEAISVEMKIVPQSCYGGVSAGMLILNGTGGHGYYYYLLNGNNWGSIVGYYNFEAGANFTWEVQDTLGCSVSGASSFPNTRVSALVLQTTNETCAGGGTAQLSATGSIGTEYSISFNGVLTNKWNYTGLLHNNYTFTVTDSYGCQDTATFTIFYISNICPCEPGQGRDNKGDCVSLCNLPTKCNESAVCNLTGATYSCTCAAGFSGDGYYCADIDECKKANGGCDNRVQCFNTIGNRTCGECPVFADGDGYTGCRLKCGNGFCESQILENCVTCPYDCTSKTCDVCGDGACTAPIGENCTSCTADCGPCVPLDCLGGCSGHGTCMSGRCICVSNWSGPNCNDNMQAINVTVNPTSPSILLNSKITINIQQIGELSSRGNLVHNFITLPDQPFTLFQHVSGSNVTLNYTSVLPNGAVINFIQYDSSAIGFGDSTIFMGRSLTTTSIVQNWPFASQDNVLQLKIGFSTINKGNETILSCTNENGTDSLRWMLVNAGSVSLYPSFSSPHSIRYAQFNPQAIVDGRARVVTYKANDDLSVSALMPHFWNNSNIETQYDVLDGQNELCLRNNNQANGTPKRHKPNEVVISVSVVAGIVGLVLLILAVQRVQLFFKYNRLRHVNSQDIRMEDTM